MLKWKKALHSYIGSMNTPNAFLSYVTASYICWIGILYIAELYLAHILLFELYLVKFEIFTKSQNVANAPIKTLTVVL